MYSKTSNKIFCDSEEVKVFSIQNTSQFFIKMRKYWIIRALEASLDYQSFLSFRIVPKLIFNNFLLENSQKRRNDNVPFQENFWRFQCMIQFQEGQAYLHVSLTQITLVETLQQYVMKRSFKKWRTLSNQKRILSVLRLD